MTTRSAHPASGGKPRKRRRPAVEIERAKRKAASARKHHLATKHHMTLEQYAALLLFQGGYCMCKRANGRTKALAVEHDHKIAREQCDHPEAESCQRCWRGLCCGVCNDMLGHGRDDPAFFIRVADYLTNPPAQEWLRLEGADG